MRIIACLNQKGGVGKTSACFHLSGALAKLGLRVLLVDVDFQASLTRAWLGLDDTAALDPAATVEAIFAGAEPPRAAVVLPTAVAGVELLPGSRALAARNVPEAYLADAAELVRLRDWLDDLRGPAAPYDVALIDCHPDLSSCALAALAAATHLLVPVQPEDFGAQGLGDVLAAFDAVWASPSPGLERAGVLVSMVGARLANHQAFERKLRAEHGGHVHAATVPRASVYAEVITTHRRPVSHAAPRTPAARAMAAVAAELAARVGIPTPTSRGSRSTPTPWPASSPASRGGASSSRRGRGGTRAARSMCSSPASVAIARRSRRACRP